MDKQNPYALAGWLSVSAAVLALPLLVLSVVVDVLRHRSPDAMPVFVTLYLIVVAAHTVFSVYAFYRLRHLLNERFGFHAVDSLIIAIILGAIAITGVGAAGRTLLALGLLREAAALGFLSLIVLAGVALSVLNVIFAVRLLSLPDDLHGLLRPYAYTCIAAAVCFASFILVPIGMLVNAMASLMLGLILLRANREPEVEFV